MNVPNKEIVIPNTDDGELDYAERAVLGIAQAVSLVTGDTAAGKRAGKAVIEEMIKRDKEDKSNRV